MTSRHYKTTEIFTDIPGDSEHIYLNLPDEICQELGWTENDVLSVREEHGELIIERVSHGE